MSLAERNHGSRVIAGPQKPRPVSTEDYSTVGALVVAPDADGDAFPLNEAVTVFTADAAKRALLGTGGNVDAVWDAIDDQANEFFGSAELQVVRVAPGAGTGQAAIEATIANMIGSGGALTGAHAFKAPTKKAKIMIAPGYTSQRIGNAANPLVAELLTIAARHRGIVIKDGPNTTKEAAQTSRADFANQKRLYMVDPHVKVAGAGAQPVVQPASGRVAGLFVRRDKTEGGPHVSPSSQTIGGIVGVARPVPYYEGDPDSEANWLNNQNIATIIDNSILFGNDSCSSDPLHRFINVVRTEDAIDAAVVKSFRWAIDNNLNVPLGVSVVQSLDDFLSRAAQSGWIIQGQVRPFDLGVNSSGSLVSGTLIIDYDREPYAPLHDLIFRVNREPDYYELVADGISRAVQQVNARRRRLIYGINLAA